MSPECRASGHAPMVGQVVDFHIGTVVTDTKNGLKYELKTRPGRAPPHFALRPHNHRRAGVSPICLKPSYDFPLGSRAVVPSADGSQPREYVKRREGWTLCASRPSSSPVVSRQTAASESTKGRLRGPLDSQSARPNRSQPPEQKSTARTAACSTEYAGVGQRPDVGNIKVSTGLVSPRSSEATSDERSTDFGVVGRIWCEICGN